MNLDQRRAPLLEAVRAAARAGSLRLHTPAHQGRVDPEYAAAMGPALAMDLTELDQTDDLRDPRGAIAAAQDLAAAHFGADRTWFLVGGASAGNAAALLALAGRRRVVVGRNAHVSVVEGLILADLEPVWVPAEWDADWDVARSPGPAAFGAALAAHPDAAGVVVTAPSYFGDPVDLRGIRAVAGDRILVVDEAHGAHAPVALAAGADVVIHSAHKGLTGPTQGGYLHVRGDRADPDRLASALRLVQTTSPNYWILAGLDAARRHARSAAASAAAETARPGAGLADRLRAAGLEVRSADPTRLLVRMPDGFAACDALAARGIVCEAALPRAVLLLVRPVGLDDGEVSHLATALRQVRGDLSGGAGSASPPPPPPPPSPPPIAGPAQPLRVAALGRRERMAAEDAIGRVCAEAVCPYPPGIPVLVPGEVVTAGAVSFLGAHAPGTAQIAVTRP